MRDSERKSDTTRVRFSWVTLDRARPVRLNGDLGEPAGGQGGSRLAAARGGRVRDLAEVGVTQTA